MDFEKIKEVLLQDVNITDVEVNEKNQLVIIPNQAKSFYSTYEPIEKYIVNETNIIEICDESFEVLNVEWFNTQIYEIILKEYGICSINLDELADQLRKEYLDKEILLSELDSNISQLENRSEWLFANSIFEHNVKEMIDTSFTYLENKDTNYEFVSGINFEFQIIKDNEWETDITVKVKDIEVI